MYEGELLGWIREEAEDAARGGRPAAAPLRLLLLRTALAERAGDPALTRSVELSLSEYTRSTVLRLLRGLSRRGLVTFTDEEDAPVTGGGLAVFFERAENMNGGGSVCLTPAGAAEAGRRDPGGGKWHER